MPKVIKATEVKYLPAASCAECEWSRAPSRFTQADVRTHVRTKGHEVIVIVETRQLWRLEP